MKGRLIRIPGGKNLRPTTEKTRGAIFSVLGDDIIDARVADLFCGSGALGIEALSRGASHALFVDSSKIAIGIVKKNVAELELGLLSEIHVMNAFLLRPAKFREISVIFADPPYKKGHGDRLISLLCLKKNVINGILVLEHESQWSYSGKDLDVLRRLNFGDTSVTFFRLPAAGSVGITK